MHDKTIRTKPILKKNKAYSGERVEGRNEREREGERERGREGD